IHMAKLIKFAVLMLLIVTGLVSFPVAAQANIRTIPINYKLFNAALSPDGKTLAVAADPTIYDNEVHPDLLPIHLFDIAGGKESGQLEGTQTDFTTGLTFSANSRQLVSLHGNGQLNIWDVSSGKVTKIYQLPGFSQRFPNFLPDGKRLMLLFPGTIATIGIVDT